MNKQKTIVLVTSGARHVEGYMTVVLCAAGGSSSYEAGFNWVVKSHLDLEL